MADYDSIAYAGDENSFSFHPDPLHKHIVDIDTYAATLGYALCFREAGYTLEFVQERLRAEGPSYFLNLQRVQEDISPPAPQPTVEQFIGERLVSLAPQTELIITDPYLFTSSRKGDASVYAESVGRIIAPLLGRNVSLTLVVDAKATDEQVKQAVVAELKAGQPSLEPRVIESNIVHDRFWIADRRRGIVMGTSLNKIGSKIFFIDRLSDDDVTAILQELVKLGL